VSRQKATIVREHGVLLGDVGLDQPGLGVVAAEGDVQVLGVEKEIGLCLLAGLFSKVRFKGLELREFQGRLPHGFVQPAVDDGGHGSRGSDERFGGEEGKRKQSQREKSEHPRPR
jgi:hypothetical protein